MHGVNCELQINKEKVRSYLELHIHTGAKSAIDLKWNHVRMELHIKTRYEDWELIDSVDVESILTRIAWTEVMYGRDYIDGSYANFCRTIKGV
jgi:hypothetical protein